MLGWRSEKIEKRIPERDCGSRRTLAANLDVLPSIIVAVTLSACERTFQAPRLSLVAFNSSNPMPRVSLLFVYCGVYVPNSLAC